MSNLSQIKTDSNWGSEAPKINQNFQNLNTDLEKVKSSTTKFKGYFTSESSLKSTFPSPKSGDTAWVGEPYPGKVYDVQSGQWHNTNTAPDTGSVDLNDYVNKTEFEENKQQQDEKFTELGNKTAGINYVTCDTAAGTAAKTITVTGLTALTTGIRLLVKMTNNNTSNNATLNINSLGAKPLYYDNVRASSDNSWEAGEVIDVYYDGTNFYSSNVQGGSSAGGNQILDWTTDVATTRLQIAQRKRKTGMIISYDNPEKGWENEQYIGTTLDDTAFKDDSNWKSFSIGSSDIGNNYLNGDLSMFIKNKLMKTDGAVIDTVSKEYVTNYLRVKKGETVIVITKIKNNANALSFYTKPNEESYVEGLNGLDAEHIPNFTSNITQSFVKIEYTPKQDGYIRVCFQDSFTLKFQDYLTYNPPTILTLSDYNEMLKEAELNTEINSLPEKYYQGYIDSNGFIISSSNQNDKIFFVFVPKGCKIEAVTAQKYCFVVFEDFIDNLFKQNLLFEQYENQLELIAKKNIYVGIAYNQTNGETFEGKKIPYVSIKGRLSQLEDSVNSKEDILLKNIDGVQDHSLPNLFDKTQIRTYDSEFANKVFEKIGRKTDTTGCYSNNIECKEGDWFTRSDFGTGIVVALDAQENILGDVANAAYQPTVQIKPSDPDKYDFSSIKYVVFVVMLDNLEDEKIVKAKYMPTGEGDYTTIPNLQIRQNNLPNGLEYYIKSKSGRYYSLMIDDSLETPTLKLVAQDGIPMSELPNDFPTFTTTGDFSEYYESLVLCPLDGIPVNYLYELTPSGLVKRYIKAKVNCPRILQENGEWYYYGVSGSLNTSSGKLNIYKANGETFQIVKENLGDSEGNVLEPHDCLVLSVSPLHYICQRYIPNTNTNVDGSTKVVTALHVEEVYDGKRVWIWKSEDYGELWNDSHYKGNNADYLHNNTISLDKDGNLCLNNKQANQMLIIKRTWDNSGHTGTIGEILWKIGGNSGNEGYDISTRIKPTSVQQWYESHDAIAHSDGTFTMYDNRSSGASRILEFGISTESKTLTSFKSYTYNSYGSRYQGSADKVSEGIYLVSWGSTRRSNAANAGIYNFNTNKAIFEIRFDATGSSAYRVYGIKKGE